MNGSAPDIEARQFRRVLGLFATGVVAVTALDPATGRPAWRQIPLPLSR
jgi:hypothetical protein